MLGSLFSRIALVLRPLRPARQLAGPASAWSAPPLPTLQDGMAHLGTRALLLCALVASLVLASTEASQGTDVINYLLLLRSAVFDQDFFLANDLLLAQKPIFVSASGFPFDLHNVGILLFWGPFYLLGYGLLALSPVGPGDYSGLEMYGLGWLKAADWVYGLLALHFTYLAAREHLSQRVALQATLFVAVGSPLLYYMAPLSPSTHMVSTFLSALFLCTFLKVRATAAPRGWSTLGVIGGLALLVANTNVALVALPLAHLLARRPSRLAVGQALRFGVWYGISFMPQLLVWWLFMGHPLKSPYGTQLSWASPQVVETLFSSYHGLFFYAPLLLLALFGLCLLARVERTLAAGSLLLCLSAIYLNSVNLAWWAGGAFGARYLLGLSPMLTLGLGWLLAACRGRWQHLTLYGSATLMGFWTFLLYLPLATHLTTQDTYYPPHEQIASILKALPLALQKLSHLSPEQGGLYLLLVPLFALLALWLLRQSLLPRQPFSRWLGARGLLLVPLLLTLFTLSATARSHAARAQCVAEGCDHSWIRSEIDQWDMAYTYVERARYHQKEGLEAAARADLAHALQLYPTDPFLHRLHEEALASGEVGKWDPLPSLMEE